MKDDKIKADEVAITDSRTKKKVYGRRLSDTVAFTRSEIESNKETVATQNGRNDYVK